MKPLTLVMEAGMLSLQLVSSWHPESETRQSDSPNPPEAREEKRHEDKQNQREGEGERQSSTGRYYLGNVTHGCFVSCNNSRV